MVTLESNVNKILDALQSTDAAPNATNLRRFSSAQRSTHDSTAETTSSPLIALEGDHSESLDRRKLRTEEIQRFGESYLEFCSCQPLPLFPKEGFVESLSKRSDSTLFAIIANSLRYTRGAAHDKDGHTFREAAHSLAVESITRGEVEISTLQTLCLIVFYDFGSKPNPRIVGLPTLRPGSRRQRW